MNTSDWSVAQEVAAAEVQCRELIKKINQCEAMILHLLKGLRESFENLEATKQETLDWLQDIRPEGHRLKSRPRL